MIVFDDLAHGTDPKLEVHDGYQIGVRIVLPPCPFDDEKTYNENSRNAAVVFETDSRDGIHLEDVKNVDGQWRVAGDNGMPIVGTGSGETMHAAREQAYERIDDIVIPNMYHRKDIGERWIAGDGDRLQAWGYEDVGWRPAESLDHITDGGRRLIEPSDAPCSRD